MANFGVGFGGFGENFARTFTAVQEGQRRRELLDLQSKHINAQLKAQDAQDAYRMGVVKQILPQLISQAGADVGPPTATGEAPGQVTDTNLPAMTGAALQSPSITPVQTGVIGSLMGLKGLGEVAATSQKTTEAPKLEATKQENRLAVEKVKQQGVLTAEDVKQGNRGDLANLKANLEAGNKTVKVTIPGENGQPPNEVTLQPTGRTPGGVMQYGIVQVPTASTGGTTPGAPAAGAGGGTIPAIAPKGGKGGPSISLPDGTLINFNGDVSQQAAAADQKAIDDIAGTKTLVGEIRRLATPDTVGVAGKAKGLSQNIGSQLQGWANRTLPSIRKDIAENVDPKDRATVLAGFQPAKGFDPTIQQFNLVAQTLSYQYARLLHGAGRLNAQDVDAARGALGFGKPGIMGSLNTSVDAVRAAMDEVERLSDEKIATIQKRALALGHEVKLPSGVSMQAQPSLTHKVGDKFTLPDGRVGVVESVEPAPAQ